MRTGQESLQEYVQQIISEDRRWINRFADQSLNLIGAVKCVSSVFNIMAAADSAGQELQIECWDLVRKIVLPIVAFCNFIACALTRWPKISSYRDILQSSTNSQEEWTCGAMLATVAASSGPLFDFVIAVIGVEKFRYSIIGDRVESHDTIWQCLGMLCGMSGMVSAFAFKIATVKGNYSGLYKVLSQDRFNKVQFSDAFRLFLAVTIALLASIAMLLQFMGLIKDGGKDCFDFGKFNNLINFSCTAESSAGSFWYYLLCFGKLCMEMFSQVSKTVNYILSISSDQAVGSSDEQSLTEVLVDSSFSSDYEHYSDEDDNKLKDFVSSSGSNIRRRVFDILYGPGDSGYSVSDFLQFIDLNAEHTSLSCVDSLSFFYSSGCFSLYIDNLLSSVWSVVVSKYFIANNFGYTSSAMWVFSSLLGSTQFLLTHRFAVLPGVSYSNTLFRVFRAGNLPSVGLGAEQISGATQGICAHKDLADIGHGHGNGNGNGNGNGHGSGHGNGREYFSGGHASTTFGR